MAGLVTIDTEGNVQISGNLAVGGVIESSGLALKANNNPDVSTQSTPGVEQLGTSGFGKLLTLFDNQGTEVAGINTSGEATFAGLTTDKITLSDDPEATSSATLAGLVYNSNASAGTASVPQGSREVTIRNSNIKSASLVFVTPTSSTSNVLYIKEQVDGEIKVGFDTATSQEVTFNWWLVELAKQALRE